MDCTLERFEPEAIVHFAEQRSAPYSMIDREHAVYTQVNNVVGTLNLLYAIAERDPSIHLVKLGTMGEYGTPNIDIEEGFIEITHKGRTDITALPQAAGVLLPPVQGPRQPQHQFACRIWGLRATDLNQGIVYGQETEETDLHPDLATRFDYDGVFGTVLNRFCVQAVVGHPLTRLRQRGPDPGHARHPRHPGLRRAGVDQPGRQGRVPGVQPVHRVLQRRSRWPRWWPRTTPGRRRIDHVEDPRVEKEEHYYRAAHTKLLDLGLVPHLLEPADHPLAAGRGRPSPRPGRPRGHPAHGAVAQDVEHVADQLRRQRRQRRGSRGR